MLRKLQMIHRCWRLRFRSEVSSIRYLLSLDLGGTTLLDIGANKGVYSIYMSRVAGPNGKVIAFEAQPELGQRLELVKRDFKLRNLEIANFGVSSKVGTLTMHRNSVGSGGAGFNWYGDIVQTMEALQVPVTTVDAFLSLSDNDKPVSFIKCDVEGHEHDVFLGAEQTLAKHKPTLLLESSQAQAEQGDLFTHLVGLGYDGYFFHVAPEDHASLLRRSNGRFVDYSEHANYPYCRPSVTHRNYLFVPTGMTPIWA